MPKFKGLLRYLTRVFFEEYFFFPSLFGTSYLAGFGIDYYLKKGEVMFNAIPPLFWPILSASIVLAGIGLRIRDYQKDKKDKIKAKHEAYCKRIETAFYVVRALYVTPGITEGTFKAWENVRFVYPELIKKRGEKVVPQMITANDPKSVGTWYAFLVDEKARCRSESEEE